MVIQAQWPGASAEEITRQVTEHIEKKLEELEWLDYTKSVTVAGQTTVFVYLRDSTKAGDVTPTWVRVRNMVADIKGDFPKGVVDRSSMIASGTCSATSTLSPATV